MSVRKSNPELFRNRYRIKSARLPNWDYSSNGYYFITICTQDRIHWFGKIEDGKMKLSDFGSIIETEWYRSFEIRNELFPGEFIIMPNHIHGVVIVDDNDFNNNCLDGFVETHGRASLQNQPSQNQPLFQIQQPISHQPIPKKLYRKPKSISSFVAGFKSATVNKIDDFIDSNGLNIRKFNKSNHLWQPRFHDHIIRNEKELIRISQYIKNNPKKWYDDDLYLREQL